MTTICFLIDGLGVLQMVREVLTPNQLPKGASS
jgi:hypothetical protein